MGEPDLDQYHKVYLLQSETTSNILAVIDITAWLNL